MTYISVQYGPNLPWSCCYSYVFLSHAFILATCLYVCSYKWALVGLVRAYIISLWGVRDLSPTCGDPHKE